jgi:MFS family permease
MATSQTPRPPAAGDESLGTLVHDLTQQISTLVRDEMRLAQAEMAEKGKKAGIGIGMFGGAGVVALYGLGALIATAILALALAMPGWLAALIVAVVLFAIAGVLALMGKSNVSKATPAKPEEAMAGLQKDVATVKGERGHDHV